jgi:hypothetical protein
VQIVDARARQRNRTGKRAGFDRHAIGRRQRLVAVRKHRAVAGRRGNGSVGGGGCQVAGLLLGLLGGGLLGLALGLLELRAGDEELPSKEHEHAQDDGQDHVAIVFVHGFGCPLGAFA